MGIITKNGVELSDEMIEQIAAAFGRGEWPGIESAIAQGRPLKFNEGLQSVTFKIPFRKLAVIDQRAAERGVSRSDYLRNLLDRDIVSA